MVEREGTEWMTGGNIGGTSPHKSARQGNGVERSTLATAHGTA